MLLVERFNQLKVPDSINSQELKDFHETLLKKETTKEIPKQLQNNKVHLLAAAINTREPIRRTVLEVSAFDLPELAAAIITKRPKANIIEILLRSLYTSSASILNPKILSSITKSLGKAISPKEHHHNILNIARFQRADLEDLESFQKGIERMEDEAEDQEFLAALSNSEKIKKNTLN